MCVNFTGRIRGGVCGHLRQFLRRQIACWGVWYRYSTILVPVQQYHGTVPGTGIPAQTEPRTGARAHRAGCVRNRVWVSTRNGSTQRLCRRCL